MTINYNPSAVTDSLLVCLDAGNPRSYSGSGSTWYDISGNKNHATLTSTYAYTSGSHFKFSAGGVATTPAFNGLTNQMSLEVVYRSNSSDSFSTYGRILDWNDTTISLGSSNTYQLRSWINIGGGRTGEFIINGIGQDNLWHHLILFSNGSAGGLYHNGQLVSSTSVSGNLENSSNYLTISNGDSYQFNGDIALVRMYSRGLTEQEIQKNFYATKGRFNL